MESWLQDLAGGFVTVSTVYVLAANVVGVIVGLIIGAVPGLTVALAISLAIPLSYTLTPITAISLLLGIYKGGIYGGSITAILINTPGTPASAATMIDGYPMALQGKAGKALKMALYAAVFGDAFSIVILVVVAKPIASVALRFGPAEIFALLVFSLTVIAALAGQSLIKGAIAAGFGFMFSIVGLDQMTGVSRFTFGNLYLSSGIGLVPMSIGLFAISELLVQAERKRSKGQSAILPPPRTREDEFVTLADFRSCFRIFMRSSVIGSLIGALPGIGSTVAGFLSYADAKRVSRNPERFGHGALEGVAAADAGSNAVVGAAMIPMLTLGIPGDTITAILLGALLIHGVVVGPQIFQTHREFVFAIFAIMLLSIVVLWVVGEIGNWAFRRITEIPHAIIFPVVLALCVIGAYAIQENMIDVFIMFGFGILGFAMRKRDVPLPPLLIAFVLAPQTEIALRQSLIISHGNPVIFLTHPISLAFLALALVSAYKLTRLARALREEPAGE